MSAFSTLGVRMGRHVGIYGLGSGGLVVVGLLSLPILTRFLVPGEFGQYALFLVFSALLTMLYNLVSMRGGMRAVFGGDDEDDDDDEEADEVREGLTRRALGTALFLTALVGAIGTLAIWPLSPRIADFLVHDRGAADLVMWAACAAALAAVGRLAGVVPRRERRPKVFILLQIARPVLILAITVPLVASGQGVDGAVTGLALGTALATVASLVATRRSFEPAFSLEDLNTIVRRGTPYVPYVVSYWTIQNAGLLILAGYVSATEIGFYRLAAGVAAIASYAVATFLKASGPLSREPIHAAVKKERGLAEAGGILANYFFLATVGLMLALTIGADLLVRIAPPAYADAAPLIPLIGLGFVMHGWFKVIKRNAKFPNRRVTYISLVVAASLVFVGAAFALIPPLGIYGAALATVIAFGTAGGVMLFLSQRGPKPVIYDYGRMLAALAIAGACYAVGRLVGAIAPEPLSSLVEILAILAYPLLLVPLGVVPREHLGPLRRIARATVPSRSSARNGGAELEALDERERTILELLVRHDRPVREVASIAGRTDEELTADFVAALRTASGVEAGSKADFRIGSYLLSSAPVAERDQLWKRMSSAGVDPLETDRLTLTLERLRRVPAEAWRRQ